LLQTALRDGGQDYTETNLFLLIADFWLGSSLFMPGWNIHFILQRQKNFVAFCRVISRSFYIPVFVCSNQKRTECFIFAA